MDSILECSLFGLEAYVVRFISSSDGLALLANCCNAVAKAQAWIEGWSKERLHQRIAEKSLMQAYAC